MYRNQNNTPYYNLNGTKSKFIVELEKAINGEYTAIVCYKKLIDRARYNLEHKKLIEIWQDENRHFKQFMHMYITITGHEYSPKLVEKCAEGHKEGLKWAFIDEQETVDFYLHLAEIAPNEKYRKLFSRAAADEQNHATWFLYFLHT